MSSALLTFNKLSPRLKAVYLTSLVLSVALMAFGAVLLSGMGQVGPFSLNSENSVAGKGGVSIGSSSGEGDGTETTPGDNYDAAPVRTDSPSLGPTPTPSMGPSKQHLRPIPLKQPITNRPTFTPLSFNSPDPSISPITEQPSDSKPSVQTPEARPSKEPSAPPISLEPNASPSPKPSKSPFNVPISSPTTKSPSASPTKSPVSSPSKEPTDEPSKSPTPKPSRSPSSSPSTSPTSKSPSSSPTKSPVSSPSKEPTDEPSKSPTPKPSRSPSSSPSTSPTAKSPSASPTNEPVSPEPSNSPASSPSIEPSDTPSSLAFPTASDAPSASAAPTRAPPFPSHAEPADPDPTYFNYNVTAGSRYGPSAWENATVLNSTDNNYWREFGARFADNRCNRYKTAQSPIDICAKPERHCEEFHEFRSRPGDFEIRGEKGMTKLILPNKLRVVMDRRTGAEPDPPHVDFAGVGASSLDLLHIDIKFPSEHTVCGRRYDGEMQYYFFHPGKETLLVVAWLFEAKADNSKNGQMQKLIDEFQEIYEENEDACVAGRSLEEGSSIEAGDATHKNDQNKKGDGGGGVWDPFHEDIQKTIHFWGYTGSLTEPPCAGSVLWRIMDVPVQITAEQLHRMQVILFNNRDGRTCAHTGTHYRGSVARPVADRALRYYKCTRSDYKSDEERDKCGDEGCAEPFFGKDLEPYVEPIVHVTGPPSEPPTLQPSQPLLDEVV